MIKKTITYTDFDDVERTEDFYFGILQSELANKELMTRGGMVSKIQSIVDSKDIPELVKLMCEFIDMSYGVKSPDGKYFSKDEESLKLFKSTKAYDKLYMELVQDTKAAIEFINGIFPRELVEKAKQNEEFNKKMKELEQ